MGGRERTIKSNWCAIWSLHVNLSQSSSFATAKGHGQLRVQITFDYRGSRQDLGRSLWDSRMDTTKPHGAPREQNHVVPAS